MTHAKAIELLSLVLHAPPEGANQDFKAAITMAIAALIAEKLNIEGG